MPILATWDPKEIPLNCRGHYGNSGSNWHWRNGTPTCDACKASTAHQRWIKRSEARDQPLSPKAARAEQQAVAIRSVRRAGEELTLGCNGKFGESGYQKHRRAGTVPCRRCLDSRNQWYRFKKPPRVTRGRAECGTMRAVWQHRRFKETLDPACKDTVNAYDRDRKRRQRGPK